MRFRPLVLSVALLLAATMVRAATPEETAYDDARAAWLRGDLKTARGLTTDALRRFESSDADAAWSLRVLHGEILNGAASCADARKHLESLRLPARLADAKVSVDRLLALASAQNRCKDPKSAKRSFVAAERLATRNEQFLGSVLVRKADFEIMSGAHAIAERDLQKLIPLAQQQKQPRIESRGWAALAKLRGQQERFDEAIDASQRALSIAGSGDAPLALVVRMNLGWLYVASGDYENAIGVLTEVDAENARLGRKADRVTDLLQLGNAYFALQQPDRASEFYRQALGVARELNHPALDFILENLARVELERNDAAGAQKFNDEAIALKRSRGGDLDSELRSIVTRARIQNALGHSDEAEGDYQRVIRDAKSRAVLAEALTFAAIFHDRVGKTTAAEGEHRRAITMSESARKDLKADELKLAFPSSQRRQYNEYIAFLVAHDRAREALIVAERSRARTLAEALGAKSQDVKLDPGRLARSSGVVLSYWLTPSQSFLWVVTPAATQIFKLQPEAEIAQAVADYQRELAGPRGSIEMSGARGEQLWRLLVGPAAAVIAGAERVVVVPDKSLHALNFETLVTPQRRYWIEDVTITTTSSLELLGRRLKSASRAMLLVGDPPQPDAAFPPLPWAASEMQRVRSHFRDATVLDGAGATPRAYEAAASQRFGFVHFVAHGIGSTTRPLDSAVVLGRDPAGYKLYAREILKHRLSARLVTISSCHGAGQRAYAGEGLVGLAWAFLRAGAHQVVAALWEVSDAATPDLMDAMYAEITRGAEPASALRTAKLRLLRSSGVYRRPLYWAPFVLYSGS